MKIKLVFLFLCCAFKSSLTLAAIECSDREVLRFQDGTTSCASQYKFFTIKRKAAPEGLIEKLPGPVTFLSAVSNANFPRFTIAMNKNLAQCPTSWLAWRGGASGYPTARFALNECEAKIKEQGGKANIDPSNCGCEVVYEASLNGPNIPLSKKDFEEKIRAWMGFTQKDPFYRSQYTQAEFDSNEKFYAEYKTRMLVSEDVGQPSKNTPPITLGNHSQLAVDLTSGQAQLNQNSSEKEQKLAEEKRIKEELAKVAQQEKEQKELALKQKKEAELQLLAEKDRKLAEEKRLQVELAEKIKADKELKIAEDRRVKDELAKVAQQDKEQKEIALKQKKEVELQAQTASQTAKATFTGKKLALVMGNARYTVHPLDNPKNDADDISRALKGVGFEVIDVRDATLSQMRSAIRSFGDKLLNNDVGLVYYSGHGIEVKGRNYFIPVNADIKRSDEIADQSIDVGLILDKMETAQKPVNILIVDACRDDPFGRSFRSGSRGLATMDAPQGTIIAFATSPGKVAADGDGRNSPYTKNLVLAMQEPNIPIEQVFKKVRRAVQQETKNQQTPWENTSLSGDFYFKVQK